MKFDHVSGQEMTYGLEIPEPFCKGNKLHLGDINADALKDFVCENIKTGQSDRKIL